MDVPSLLQDASRAGYSTFVLPPERIVDRRSFFEAVRDTLPLDPPLGGFRSWDALSDSLWEGLRMHPSERIVILWPDADRMAASAAADFESAVSVLTDVASTLADSSATLGTRKDVAILIEQGGQGTTCRNWRS